MKHFTNFSNSARKSFTRQKQASLLGQAAPSTSYVDRIQTARRGATSDINSPYYISRNEVMTHPQDNTKLSAVQKKFQTLATRKSNEYGVQGYRTRNNKGLELTSIIEGTENSVKIPQRQGSNIFTMHSHQDSSNKPSKVDLQADEKYRNKNKGKYESLIFNGLEYSPSKDQTYSITSYKGGTAPNWNLEGAYGW
jgi:hypothetical protein